MFRDYYEKCKDAKIPSLLPGDVANTTEPQATDLRLSGPVGLSLQATPTRPETMFVAQLQDIASDGAVTDLTGGAQKVPIGKVTPYDIEILPAFLTVPKNHRLRVGIKTGDVPHLLPPPMKLTELLGGIYGVQHNAKTPSWIDLQVTR